MPTILRPKGIVRPNLKPIRPTFDVIIPSDHGDGWTNANAGMMAGWSAKGNGVYLVTLPESWMYLVKPGSAVMEASNQFGRFIFDGRGWMTAKEDESK